MTSRTDPEYAGWVERNATTSVLAYGALIAVLLPLFHFVLIRVPGVPPGSDSLALRFVAAGFSLLLVVLVLTVPAARRHAATLQFLQTLMALLVVVVLVVNSGDHYAYIASGLLVILGAQQAFFRVSHLAEAFGLAFVMHVAYSALHGTLETPMNVTALAIFGGGYVLGFVPAAISIRVQQSEVRNRIAAQRAGATLQEVQAITGLGNWSRELRSGRVEWSPELCRIFAVPAAASQSSLTDAYERAIHPADRGEFGRRLASCRASGEAFTFDHRIVTAEGHVRWVQLHGKFEYDAAHEPVRWVGAVLDITERKQAEEALSFLAQYDQLTGLPNRTTIQERLVRALDAARADDRACSVVFLDLDRFKDVNDSLGHEIGDQLLVDVSRRFALVLPPHAVLGRWGGDEFVAIVPGSGMRAELEQLARRLVDATGEPFYVADLELSVTASAGVASFPEDGLDAGSLIANADTAMYLAKDQPGNAFAFFTASLRTELAARRDVLSGLRKAIADEHLVLYYQPIFDAATGRISGAEALVRWREPGGRLRPPAEFVPIAEESGLIVALGTWVLKAACDQAGRWERRGVPLTVAVNVSPRQFAHAGFLDTVALVLRNSGIDPRRLEIELTEEALMAHREPVLATLQAIHETGIGVAIDDFGTGYSSFAYLRRFAVDSLKIDRSFVKEIGSDRNAAIVKSIISVAHALDLPVTAEGVETAEQRAVLTELGCERLQGFLLGRPVPLDEFEARFVTPPHPFSLAGDPQRAAG